MSAPSAKAPPSLKATLKSLHASLDLSIAHLQTQLPPSLAPSQSILYDASSLLPLPVPLPVLIAPPPPPDPPLHLSTYLSPYTPIPHPILPFLCIYGPPTHHQTSHPLLTLAITSHLEASIYAVANEAGITTTSVALHGTCPAPMTFFGAEPNADDAPDADDDTPDADDAAVGTIPCDVAPLAAALMHIPGLVAILTRLGQCAGGTSGGVCVSVDEDTATITCTNGEAVVVVVSLAFHVQHESRMVLVVEGSGELAMGARAIGKACEPEVAWQAILGELLRQS